MSQLYFGLALLLVGCGGDRSPNDHPSPTDTDTATGVVTSSGGISARIEAPPAVPNCGPLLGLRTLSIRADVPVRVSMRIEGDGTARTVAFDELSASQDLPILGLRLGKDYTVAVTATDATGNATAFDPLPIDADPFPADWPIIEVVSRDAPKVAPGYIQVMPKGGDFAIAHLTFLDPELQATTTWSYCYDIQDTDMIGDGTFITRMNANGWLMDLEGNVIHQWGYQQLDPAHYLPTATEEFHHEIIPLGTKFAALSSRTIHVPGYPTTYEEPNLLGPAANIRDSSLAVMDMATGAVEHEWFVADYIDPERISYDALTITTELADLPYDWSHANAADQDVDGGWIIALRHQDILLKLDADGNLMWMLGDHANWKEEWRPYLLTLLPGGTWPYHEHGVSVDKATGLIVMMDNANNGTIPPTPSLPNRTSRAVAFRVDPVAMTVEQVWAYDQTSTGKLYSNTLGSVYILPNGNIFSDFGSIDKEGTVDDTGQPASADWGNQEARIVEWKADEPDLPVLDLRVRSDAATLKAGWTTYRAAKLASLYPTSGAWRATETWEP